MQIIIRNISIQYFMKPHTTTYHYTHSTLCYRYTSYLKKQHPQYPMSL